MIDGVPAKATPEELALFGARIQEPQAYWRALLRSAYRQELLLTDQLAATQAVLAELRARPLASPAEPPKGTPKGKPAPS